MEEAAAGRGGQGSWTHPAVPGRRAGAGAGRGGRGGRGPRGLRAGSERGAASGSRQHAAEGSAELGRAGAHVLPRRPVLRPAGPQVRGLHPPARVGAQTRWHRQPDARDGAAAAGVGGRGGGSGRGPAAARAARGCPRGAGPGAGAAAARAAELATALRARGGAARGPGGGRRAAGRSPGPRRHPAPGPPARHRSCLASTQRCPSYHPTCPQCPRTGHRAGLHGARDHQDSGSGGRKSIAYKDLAKRLSA